MQTKYFLITKSNKCKHCKKPKGDHKANTLHCPTGSKSRIGYLSYHTINTFEIN